MFVNDVIFEDHGLHYGLSFDNFISQKFSDFCNKHDYWIELYQLFMTWTTPLIAILAAILSSSSGSPSSCKISAHYLSP